LVHGRVKFLTFGPIPARIWRRIWDFFVKKYFWTFFGHFGGQKRFLLTMTLKDKPKKWIILNFVLNFLTPAFGFLNEALAPSKAKRRAN
jgi:hypothetical protein